MTITYTIVVKGTIQKSGATFREAQDLFLKLVFKKELDQVVWLKVKGEESEIIAYN